MQAFVAAPLMALAIVTTTSAQQPTPVSAPIVFFDSAGPAPAKLKDFYDGNFGCPGLAGTLRQDSPETLIYLGVRNSTTPCQ